MRRSLKPNRRRILAVTSDLLEPRQLMASTWQNVQIGGGGYVVGLASSGDGSAIYMRTDVGGAYRWNASTNSWNPITDALPPDFNNNGGLYGIASLAVDPSNPNRVFIAAGKYEWNNPSGLYYTTNANAASPSWTVVDSTIRANGNGAVRQNGERLLVDPNNSNILYYGTNNVTNGGVGLKKYYYDTSWHSTTITTPANGDSNRGIIFVAADENGGTLTDSAGRTVSRYLYVGVYSDTAGSGGVYASSNGGASWTKVTGLSADKLFRGEVGVDGTLYVTYDGGVAKVTRGATTFTSITPPGGNTDFCSLAADPAVAGTVMVADFTFSGTGRVWRSLDGGATWILMNRIIHATEPDGTPSVTSNGSADHVADLLINPANLDEVWACDFLGVSRTQNIKDDATATSDWYLVQKGDEEVVVLDMKSAPTGAPLATAVADVNGFMHDDVSVRPTRADRFDVPTYLSTTSVDFCEATTGSNGVWARVGQLYYSSGPTGGFSLDDGRSWAEFGELDRRFILNATSAGWETFDVGPYLKQQKAAGINTVTLVVRSDSWETNQSYLTFSSKEGSNAPKLLLNGSQTVTVSEDAGVYANNTTTNYGSSTTLIARSYYEQAWCTWHVYLKFNLASVASIDSAQLQLYRLAGNGAYSFNTTVEASPTTTWTQGTITWANRPADLFAPPTGTTDRGGRIAISATDPANMVWLMESGHVWYTKDRGVRWTEGTIGGSTILATGVTEFQQDKVALASDRVAAGTFYLYNKRTAEIYRSTDGGVTWSVLASSVGQPESYKLETLPGVANRFWLVGQSWNMAETFRYWNGTSLVNVPGITNVVDFTFGKPAAGRTNPTVFARKADGTYWYSTDASAGSTYTWTQVNAPAIGNGPHVMEGDRQSFGRLYVGTDGRGAYYIDADPAPTVLSVTINDGAAQRSMVRKLSVLFSEPVTLSANALQVKLQNGMLPPNTTVTVSNPSADQKTYILTFSGTGAAGGSLADGIYDLIISASGVQDLVGVPLAADYTQRFHRLFGDADGNKVVNALDYAKLKATYGRTAADPLFSSAFDYEGNSIINALDLAQFRKRYGLLYTY